MADDPSNPVPKRLFAVAELIKRTNAVHDLKRSDELIALIQSLKIVAEVPAAEAAEIKKFFVALGLDRSEPNVTSLDANAGVFTERFSELDPEAAWCFPKP